MLPHFFKRLSNAVSNSKPIDSYGPLCPVHTTPGGSVAFNFGGGEVVKFRRTKAVHNPRIPPLWRGVTKG